MSDTGLEYLAGSSVRPEALAVLREHDRLALRDVAERLPASRRTAKRTLHAMESRGWVRAVDGTYELTALGAALLSAYEEFRECERIATRYRPFLEHVPAAALDLDIETLADATVVCAGGDPTAFADSLVDLRAEATRVREYTPFLLLDSVRQLANQVEHGRSESDVTLVLRTDVPPQSSPEYAERFETLVAAQNVDILVYPDGPSIGFGVADGDAFFGAADTRDRPTSLLVSDTPDAISWVERQFEACLDAAEPVTLE